MGHLKRMASGTGAALAASALTMLAAGAVLAAVIASETKLTATHGAPGDLFDSAMASSVAPSGRTAVIAAHGDDDGGDRAGAAYIFHDDGIGWAEQAKLTASDGVLKDFFAGLSKLESSLRRLCFRWRPGAGKTNIWPRSSRH